MDKKFIEIRNELEAKDDRDVAEILKANCYQYHQELNDRATKILKARENLEQAKKDFEDGVKSGKYIAPYDAPAWNWRAGERYNRMLSYISDLRDKAKI